MPDESPLLAAIAEARARRLRSQAMRYRASIVLLFAAIVGIVAITWLLHQPQPRALAADQPPSLSIEEAIAEACDGDDGFPDIDWGHWLGVNPDIVGWMTIEGTGVDHPIVRARSDRPTFYLSHAVDGSDDGRGSVFLDAECEGGLDAMHPVVYGHNWDNGLVFSDIAEYLDPAFASSHREVLLQTPSSRSRLSIQCVELANGTDSSNVLAFSGEEEMAAWYRERFLASAIRLGYCPIDGDGPERVYTFCTCADGKEDKRVLVYAIPETKARAASREASSTV